MFEKEALCCCEYYDINNERNHILACCCNCTECDQCFENAVSCKKIQFSNIISIMKTCQDRIRIPWPGGAKPLLLDNFLSCIYLPLLLMISSLSLWSTIVCFSLLIISIIFFKKKVISRKDLFVKFTVISFLFIYLVFELLVIPFLEILISENIAVNVLVIVAVLSVYYMKKQTYQFSKQSSLENMVLNKNIAQECNLCQAYIPKKDHHSVWLNCCVGQHNKIFYFNFLISTISALIYSSNLTLTTVCHPFQFYKTILLPDDCSEVYLDFELSLSFVAALYSLLIATYLIFLLLCCVPLRNLGFNSKRKVFLTNFSTLLFQ